MYPYLFYFIFIIIVFLAFIFDYLNFSNKITYRRVYNIVYIYLACLVALRYGVGTDTPGYMIMFNEIPVLSKITIYDFVILRAMPGFVLVLSIFKTIFGDFVYFQIFQASMFFGSIYFVLRRLDLCKFYLLITFYGSTYFAEMQAMKECLGISFCLIGLNYYLKQKIKYYYFFVFIGMMFHTGMFVFLLFPLVRRFKIIDKTNFLKMLAVFVVFLCFFIDT